MSNLWLQILAGFFDFSLFPFRPLTTLLPGLCSSYFLVYILFPVSSSPFSLAWSSTPLDLTLGSPLTRFLPFPQRIVVVPSLNHVWLFAPPWAAAYQGPLSSTVSWSLFNSCPLSQWFYLTISSSATLLLLPSIHRESIIPILPTIWNSHHIFCFPLFTYLSELPLLWLWIQRHCFGLLPYFAEKAITNINFANTCIYSLFNWHTL